MFKISNKNWNTIIQYAKIAYDEDKNEISGFLIAMPINHVDYELIMPDILKQENTGTTTELDGEAVQEWAMNIKTKLDKNPKYKGKDFRTVWWHSHHTMGAEWSGTDYKEIEKGRNKDWTLSLLVNLKNEYKLRVNFWHPVETHEEVELEFTETVKINKSVKEKYDKLCKNATPVVNKIGTWHNYKQNTLFNTSQNNKSNDDKYEQFSVDLENAYDNYLTFGQPSKDAYKKLIKNIKKLNKIHKTNEYEIDTEVFNMSEQEFHEKIMVFEDMIKFKRADIENHYLTQWGNLNGYY